LGGILKNIMASGIFALLDDITVLLDDIASMSKVAAGKTSAILGDDLAVNAEKASGFSTSREIPVLWAITKGSFLNKVIILPLAFLLSAFLPSVITIVLIAGGLYFAYEGVEKIVHFFLGHNHESSKEITADMNEAQLLEYEKSKIKSAIITDFILSVEIIVIALSTVMNERLVVQIGVVSVIAILATVGVYGVVALIVRMDEAGFYLIRKSKNQNGLLPKTGWALVNSLPYVIRALAVIGTLALVLVAGGIFAHNINVFHDFLPQLPVLLSEFILGLLIGLAAVLLFQTGSFLYKKIRN